MVINKLIASAYTVFKNLLRKASNEDDIIVFDY